VFVPPRYSEDEARFAIATTEFGTREFATLDQDGNLIGFFRWI
jgi:hypothetical protein